MSTTVIYSDTADDVVESQNAAYATAREGGTLALGGGTLTLVGQTFAGGIYRCDETFTGFDTSGLSGVTTSAVLSLNVAADLSTTDFTAEARVYDWGATVTTADYVAGSALSALTLVATRSSVGVAVDAYADFTDVAMVANLNLAGTTRLLIHSDRHRLATTPTDSERVQFYPADEAGTTKDPKLTIVTLDPVLTAPFAAQQRMG